MILQNFIIAPFDTVSNILIKVAAMSDSIPKYIHLKGVVLDINALKRQRVLNGVEVIDMLSVIRDIPDIKRFAEALKNIIGFFPNLNITQDIITPWVYFHLNNIPEDQMELIMFSTVGIINNAIGTNIDLSLPNFDATRRAYMRDLEARIAENHRLALAIEAMNVDVQGVYHTAFAVDKIKYAIELGQSSDTTLNEIFNSIILNPSIPFASMNGYYKVLKDFIPDPSWATYTENIITIKLLKNEMEYEDINFIIDKGIFTIVLNADTDKQSKDALVQRILDVIPNSKSAITAEKSISLKGVFYIPNQTLNKYVFADMVMNNPVFSQLVIDEVGKATKEKSSMYVYYNTGTYMMSTIITPKIMDRFDPTMKGQDPDLFPEGSPYVRIRVTGRDMESIAEFQQNFSKLITTYNLKYNEVVEIYRKYIPMFPEVEEKVIRKKEKSKFVVTGGARRCQNPPIIIDKADVGKYADTMVFPADKGQIYTCDIPERGVYKHIGLQYRKDIDDFVPCCFKIDQKNKPGSNYNKYLKFLKTGEKEAAKVAAKQQRLIKTKKFVSNGNFGDLYYAEPIKFFEMANPTVKYFRLGVHRSRMSLVNCVMEVFREPGTPAITVRDVRAKLEQIANKADILSVCRQEIPDKSPAEIRQMILSPDTYIDPKLFSRVLEVAFGCRIFTFSENGLEIPRHFKNYISYDHPYDKNIVIMEHMGSESDNALYPQCEIIVQVSGDESVYFFNKREQVSIYLDEIFRNMTRSYMMGKLVGEYVMDLPNIVGQTIDLYGKVNSFVVSHPKGNFLVYTEVPMPPLAVLENLQVTYLPTSDDILKLYDNFKYIVRENDSITSCVEVTFTNTYIVPIQPISVPSKAPKVVRDVVIPIKDSQSGLRSYNLMRKLARYITEYALFAYSTYIHDRGLSMSVESLSQFIDTVVVDPTVSYGMISKKFSTSDTIMRGGRLVVPSVEISRRLVFAIRLEMFKNPDNLLSYYKRTNIEAYIKDISDFTEISTQVILYGQDSLIKYIRELTLFYRFNYDIGFTGAAPFFYKNSILESRVYIGQSADTLITGKSHIYNWERYGVNSGYPEHDVSTNEYSYRSEMDIRPIRRGEGDSAVLGYLVNGTPRYTALMGI
jgi:hypothetical protein